MRHCCEFDAFDIWYLKDDEEFSDKVVFIGVCPICKKQVAVMTKRKIKTNSIISLKKAGDTVGSFLKEISKEVVYSRNDLNKMKFTSKPFGWKYGVNKEKKDKNGNKIIEQYAKDFYGNKELVKKSRGK
ncbi:MAG: hypothetical protein K6E29_05240 [Cyanobacteria bacterium RUI128]|nr:hypothetical protein [Cyanobacteria bacterium RUI128]